MTDTTMLIAAAQAEARDMRDIAHERAGEVIELRARAEAAEAEVRKLESAPLCGGHAATWYTSRNGITTDSGCIMCDWQNAAADMRERAAALCEEHGQDIGAVDGYDYRSGEEYAYRRAAQLIRALPIEDSSDE